jgi:phosphoglycerate dehydrogenase-like enzyme
MHQRVILWTQVAVQVVAQGLRAIDGVELVVATHEAEAIAQLADAEGLVIGGHEGGYTAAVAAAVRAAPKLKWLQITSTGQDGIDRFGTPAALPLGGIGDSYAPVVAEHALSLLLALGRRLDESFRLVQEGRWDRSQTARMSSLEDSTLCIAGFGRIGRGIAQRAQAFGMRCIAINTSGRLPDDRLAERAYTLAALDQALAESDALAIALPLNAQTRGCFAAPQWAACRPGLRVVNIGRGALIDTPSLVEALHSGQVGGAGLDVTDPEPLPQGHPLWTCPHLILTPHVGGGGSPRSQQRVVQAIGANVRRFIAGAAPLHPIAAATS